MSRGRAQLEQGVRKLVERSLQRSGPGATFTAAVIAAVAMVPSPAQAAPATGATATGGYLAWTALGLAAAVAIGIFASSMLESPAVDVAQHVPAPAAVSTEVVVATALPESRPAGERFRSLASAARVAAGPSDNANTPTPEASGYDSISDVLHHPLARRIDVDLSNASVENVLRMLGEAGGVDIIVRGDIASSVTFDLQATTVQEALDATLEQAAAVWREVDMVRVVGGAVPAGPSVDSSEPITISVVDVPFCGRDAAFA